ncbi:uncharacterized protein LOC126561960 [Anopheles maculipalpis]|uniref:uncharacterized protein LOC126561960 n=1 Tax=Anopheles maculipalpis TaxID=1496333 RepID=UPI0021593191|nr:uncharacterized protein LOC126561960 [Anopheles maculipalpis]
MENKATASETPPCHIDKKLPNRTYITAWRDKNEFKSVYEQIFTSPVDDIATKEKALEWLNMWKIRQVKDFPVCIRCTQQVLEAQLFDLRTQRDATDSGKATEIKNIYAGAFTRFINFLTEASGPRKETIADSVRKIGIETYLVELRHLCAHKSVSISIDVFRRSAQYCMDWLNRSYWQRELACMESVNAWSIMGNYLAGDLLSAMNRILRTYDAVTAARVRKALTLDAAIKSVGLTADEVELLEAHAEWRKSARLRVIQNQTVEQLQALKLPPTQVAVNAVCKAVFENCKRMFRDAELYGEDETVPLAKMHSALFRGLAAMGCVQTFFKQLIVICEQDSVQTAHQRPWATYWAQRIAAGFQLLREFKKHCSTLPPEQVSRYGQASPRIGLAQNWYEERLKCATNHHLMLGLYVDCPWHLRLHRSYVMARLMAMNDYTKDIVPILLTLQEPPLSDEQLQNIKQLTHIYYDGSDVISTETSGKKNIPSEDKKANGHYESSTKGTQIYTAEDLKDVIANVRNKRKSAEEEIPSKRAKQYGLWTEPDVTLDWGKYPLGTCLK